MDDELGQGIVKGAVQNLKEKIKKKSKSLYFFVVGHNFSPSECSSSVEYNFCGLTLLLCFFVAQPSPNIDQLIPGNETTYIEFEDWTGLDNDGCSLVPGKVFMNAKFTFCIQEHNFNNGWLGAPQKLGKFYTIPK